ncbi:stabilin-1 isoform X2 [Alosa sapidissima]|uniref:stabilin-1 isoform X2 n=1 Tax=Alosa sapidissima TaxID=34773 RepID=UPI001C08696F|nr:stabilin-1 isoform X2 [Alosa sapidissima]
MLYLLILGILVPCSFQQETHSRCDEHSIIQYSTPCTACAAASTVTCPRGFRKITTNTGNANCSYTVQIGQRTFNLPGCSHTCIKTVTERRCCPNFWGPRCLPCPSWSGKACNWHGTCLDGPTGNGTCVCKNGFSGLACQECTNKNAYGEHCNSECSCANGDCNSGPDGDGECYCQPPFSGPKCDTVSESCKNCTDYHYCKGENAGAICECLPGFKRIGRICARICVPGSCDKNAECSVKAGRFECKCHLGYEGDGKVCVPVDHCAQNNGGCPANSTICDYKGPGQVVCSCLNGMESSNPSTGCVMKSACTDSTCHISSLCQTGQDGIPRCICSAQQVGDGYRCFGTIMERIVELNHAGDLTGAIHLFRKGCELSVSQRGPFTALVPFLRFSLPGVSESSLCKHHLILGQHLSDELKGNDIWTYSGETIRFKTDKTFIFMRDPDTLFTIKESNIVASNGIIHIIDKPITNLPSDASNTQLASQTIGDILAEDTKFNRFVSLLDNCGASMPLRGPGPLTVFVPTNNAIDRFRDGSVLYMLSDARHKLQELLKHHMFSEAALTVDQLASMSAINTMAKQVINIKITNDGRILLGEKGAPLETKDIIASNGVIHLIDGVLVPSSIVPILPHRCDVNESKIIQGPCVRCSYLFSTECPSGSTELDAHLKGCEASPVPPFSATKIMGCAKYCKVTKTRPECCKGFYGPDCKPCIGGFTRPCYDKGICLDGIQGNGSCQCAPGFTGIACHICSDLNKHGENCDEDCHCVHGECDNRPHSQGICRRGSCLEGYSGDHCDKTATPCNSDGVFEHCHINAYCSYSGSNTICVCRQGYEGDGHSCTPVNLCLKPIRGGCDSNAQCVYIGPGNISCICNEGWTGDGAVCAEINNCLLESRGGCHKNADCVTTGPGQNDCSCKKGYLGDGLVCSMANPCLKNNGGCHELATCKQNGTGLRNCVCPENYQGDGITCYGSILMELDGNSDYYSFYRLIQTSHLFNLGGNITALVPSRSAFKNLSSTEETFWFDYYRLPHLLKAHFLDGVFSYEDLQQHVNQQLPTLQTNTKWDIKNISGEIVVENATILVPDIPAVNGYIHIINTVLRPPISALPPVPPDLMDFLNKTPMFSLFRKAALHLNLTDNISKEGHTLLIPFDSAIEEFLKKTNSTELSEDVFKYHIIPDEQIFPDHISDGTLKSTLLGKSYHIMFHINGKNQTLANEVPLDGTFNETRRGVVIGIPQVLEIHKNHCNKEVFQEASGRCVPCDSTPKCYSGAIPLKEKFPPNMKSNCKYRKKLGTKRKSVNGCKIKCLKKTLDHSCCPGYYGHECFKCPGKIDNWCSNNGKCQDGVQGSGECLCKEGFHGTSCEMCQPGRYGSNCTSECKCNQQNGKCMDGINGNGTCVCFKGWKGEHCSVDIGQDKCEGKCAENANCISNDGGTPTCSCVAGYKGDGLVCKEINLCESYNGGCSPNANCTHISPAERVCTCKKGYYGDGVVCLETDPCLKNNGGCDTNALCIKTGPDLHACLCKVGYSGDGVMCAPLNLCWKENGGCSINAKCRQTGPGERNCTCYHGYRGDGFNCAGSISRELSRLPGASWYRSTLSTAKIRDMFSKGPLTVFVPHSDYIENSTITLAPWFNASRAPDLLRYHIVACEELTLTDLKSIDTVVSASGHELKFSVKEGVLYLNEDAKIVQSDHLSSNGVIHFLDKILTPYDLSSKVVISPKLNVTAAAEAYGYSQFSKLLKDTNLVTLVENKRLQPFTMFWPSDEALNSLSAERKTWLYSEDHRDKLEAFIKAHMVRDTTMVAVNLLTPISPLRSMYGSSISISCDKSKIGKLLINNNEAKIMERHLIFDVGIAYGIDQLLEPPNLGARCDGLDDKIIKGRCGSCFRPPDCPYLSQDTGKKTSCFRHHSFSLYPRMGIHRSSRWFDSYDDISRLGCRRECKVTEWTFRCCKNHYGMNCQVCPGGLEAPCGVHGDCHDGRSGTGTCKCHPGFKGSSCELCVDNHYGSNCTACMCTTHGKCEDGMDGSGKCFCEEGWTGNYCESRLESKPVCSPGCHPNAVCLGNKTDSQCECQDPFIGDGLNCTAPDFCSEYNGGCHQHAECQQVDLNVTCSCKTGYSGDGNDCSPIDRCTEENGGCSDFATCMFTGPNERRCQCNDGYVGDGLQCLEKVIPPIDRCLDNNGGCDPKASCKDLHFHTKTAGVFHLRSPEGKYKMNFTSAEAGCKADGAMLATFNQLSDAQQLGMHLCVAGWIDGKKVGYPITFPSAKCGDNRVGVILYKDPVDTNRTYDAYCYRMKDVECVCKEEYIGDGSFCNGNLASVLAMNDKLSTFYTAMLTYANTAEEGQNLMNFLSARSSFATLFVPHNKGFSVNETLSQRDMEYHISINNSFHVFENLTHNLVIPSRLGYSLTIVIPADDATLSDNFKPHKLVNKRSIVDWDIPAINGIIHIIDGPLKAPPEPVKPLPHPQSGGVSGVPIMITLFILLAATGMAYYVFRYKKDAFRFQYFKNEDDGGPTPGSTNPALVSIPNPCYSGYTAFAEPFEDSATTEHAGAPNLLE